LNPGPVACKAHTLSLNHIPSIKIKHPEVQFIKRKIKTPCVTEKNSSKGKDKLLPEYLVYVIMY
jgi:hypothetical protein